MGHICWSDFFPGSIWRGRMTQASSTLSLFLDPEKTINWWFPLRESLGSFPIPGSFPSLMVFFKGIPKTGSFPAPGGSFPTYRTSTFSLFWQVPEKLWSTQKSAGFHLSRSRRVQVRGCWICHGGHMERSWRKARLGPRFSRCSTQRLLQLEFERTALTWFADVRSSVRK